MPKKSAQSKPKEQSTTNGWVRNFLAFTGAEFIGTYLLVLFPTGIAAGISLYPNTDPITGMLVIALAFGGTLFGLIMLFAKRSGANFNPAITIGLWRAKQMPGIVAVVYVIAQFAGGILGAATVRLAFLGRPAQSFAVTVPADGAGIVAVLAVEFFGTLWLTHNVATVAIGKKSELASALTLGAGLGLLVLIGEFFTGGAYNPARAIGPMLVNGKMQYWWYVVPELIGGWLGVKLYMRGFKGAKQPK